MQCNMHNDPTRSSFASESEFHLFDQHKQYTLTQYKHDYCLYCGYRDPAKTSLVAIALLLCMHMARYVHAAHLLQLNYVPQTNSCMHAHIMMPDTHANVCMHVKEINKLKFTNTAVHVKINVKHENACICLKNMSVHSRLATQIQQA